MKYWLLSFLLVALLLSCNQRSKLKKEFNNNAFDVAVIKSLPLYDSLKNILVKNLDTIVKFRNSRKPKRTENFYIFNYDDAKASDEGIDDMPAFLYPFVEKICQQIGKENIMGFTLYPDSAIEISTKSIYKERVNASVNHQLDWKMRSALGPAYDLFIRDTILAPRWTYYISVDERND